MMTHIQYSEGYPDTLQMRAAIIELVELRGKHYPAAVGEVTASPEDAQAIHLYPTVDLTDTDELVDLVIDRELALHEQGVPTHVIPLPSPAAATCPASRAEAKSGIDC